MTSFKNNMKKNQIITFTTDFGLNDNFAGIMKGIILNCNPGINIVDITHNVSAQNIFCAGYMLNNSYKYFPKKTVHCCVVDPGVESSRKILAFVFNGHFFVMPDNGIISGILGKAKPDKIVSVENPGIFLKTGLPAFHGSYIFAPISAYIAEKESIDDLGPVIASWVKKETEKPYCENSDTIIGKIICIDTFGNLITNIPSALVKENSAVMIKNHKINSLSGNYSSCNKGEVLALIGSTNLLEISVNMGNAKEYFQGYEGMEVKVFL